MSTKHSKAAGEFLKNRDMAAWHDETLWMVRAKRDKIEPGGSRVGTIARRGMRPEDVQ